MEENTPSKEELLEIIDNMVRRIEDLPIGAALAPITHADFASLLMIIASVLKAK